MKKSIILTIALLASVNAYANYLFINVTDRGHAIQIDGQSIKNNGSASIMDKASYKVVIKEESGKERETVFTPKKDRGTVVAVTFGEILRKPYATQYTLEKAKKKYGKRVQFSK